jgi:hypothetical protein
MNSLPLMDEKLLRYMNIGIKSGIANATNSTIAPPSSRRMCQLNFRHTVVVVFLDWRDLLLINWFDSLVIDWRDPLLINWFDHRNANNLSFGDSAKYLNQSWNQL